MGSGNGLQVFESKEQEAVRQQLIDPAQQSGTRIVASELKRKLAVSEWGTNAEVLEKLLPKVQPAAQRQETAPDATNPAVAAVPVVTDKAVPEQVPAPAPESSAGELQIQWKQQGDAVAPLLEMRAYLDQLKEAGVAVGPMKFEKGADGKQRLPTLLYRESRDELAQLSTLQQSLEKVGLRIDHSRKLDSSVPRELATKLTLRYRLDSPQFPSPGREGGAH